MSIHSSLSRRPDSGRRPGNDNTSSNPALDDAELDELKRGLMASPAEVSPKYLYDTVGSKLFETLCLLPEYYPTRTEAAILRSRLADIARVTSPSAVLIDLGAGNCAKAEQLFDALAPSHYVAVDISAEFVRNALRRLRPRHPEIRMKALGQDFSRGVNLPDDVPTQNRLFFYPGSSLGNFAPTEAHRFLAGLRQTTQDKASLLLGVDLVKDTRVLNAAYDDALGLTSAFNLNLLRNLNRLLSADFDVRDWQHQAFFNERHSRIEMYLQARRDLEVHWDDQTRHFARGERIHTENSYKYTRESLTALLEEAGWKLTDFWTDESDWFAVLHAQSMPVRA
ncbi:L-histidine N(alpha)-methyltransferase [Pusillimonas sp.]|uniref:L-histidine N(alpha)-methyltransferase n=1 Tax=Pusillimonas sp. TaxID=3040095 RepID=UPI0037CC872D